MCCAPRGSAGRLSENKLTTSGIASLRDDEETKCPMVTKIIFFSLSLFQLKDEPERAGIRRLRKAPFYFEIG
jgi:hypothetical protein